MRKENLKVGDVVVAMKDIQLGDRWTNICKVDGSYGNSIKAGTSLLCKHVGPYTWTKLYDSVKHTTFRANSLAYLELASTATLDKRQSRIEVTRKQVSALEEKVLRLQNEVHSTTETLTSERKKLELLERFASDEEELAFTLSEILKAGPDEKAILELLRKRQATHNL